MRRAIKTHVLLQRYTPINTFSLDFKLKQSCWFILKEQNHFDRFSEVNLQLKYFILQHKYFKSSCPWSVKTFLFLFVSDGDFFEIGSHVQCFLTLRVFLKGLLTLFPNPEIFSSQSKTVVLRKNIIFLQKQNQ